MSNLHFKSAYRRYLPHIQQGGATFFVTFRLVDSLPAFMREQLKEETQEIEKRLQEVADLKERSAEAYREHKRQFGRYNAFLDKAEFGPTWLKQPEIAHIVANSLHFLDQDKYDLDTYCIMCNHVHVLFTPLQKPNGEYYSLSSIAHSLKRHTAREANNLLGRTGAFWQHESYDHIVRDEAELRRIVQYIINNPVKARLVDSWQDWEWTYTKYIK